MAKKLGRGLSNLIPGNQSSAPVSSNPNYQEISIGNLKANPDQPRKKFSEKEIEELASTLHSVGLIEPIVVRKIGDDYQIISGERRFRACKKAGFKKIPCVIKNVNDLQALEMGIIENIQREELNAVEEALAYEHWMQKSGLKPSDLALKVGKDRSTITNLIRLLKLPREILELLASGKITAGQARPLLSIADVNKSVRLAKKITVEGWTARKVEDEVSRIQEPAGRTSSGSSKPVKKDANVAHLENKLRSRLTTRVSIQHKKNGSGKISIGYANLDELDRIMELLSKK